MYLSLFDLRSLLWSFLWGAVIGAVAYLLGWFLTWCDVRGALKRGRAIVVRGEGTPPIVVLVPQWEDISMALVRLRQLFPKDRYEIETLRVAGFGTRDAVEDIVRTSWGSGHGEPGR